jgi:hypothetical protein
MASNAIKDAGAEQRMAAAMASGGAGFDGTILTGPHGAPKPSTAVVQLFGQAGGKQTLGE